MQFQQVTQPIMKHIVQFDLAVWSWYRYRYFHWHLQQSSAEKSNSSINNEITNKTDAISLFRTFFLSFVCRQRLYTLSGLVGILTVTSPENRTWYTKGPLTPATILSSWKDTQFIPWTLSSSKRTRLIVKDRRWYNAKCGPPPHTCEMKQQHKLNW